MSYKNHMYWAPLGQVPRSSDVHSLARILQIVKLDVSVNESSGLIRTSAIQVQQRRPY